MGKRDSLMFSPRRKKYTAVSGRLRLFFTCCEPSIGYKLKFAAHPTLESEQWSPMWKASERLMDTISHYASFPATGVSLRQMVQFGHRPSTGMLYTESVLTYSHRTRQELSFAHPNSCGEDSQIPLAHRVKELVRLAGWIKPQAFDKKGAGLVCTVIRGSQSSPSTAESPAWPRAETPR
ncbi:hypothetical protein CISG_10167 [Coccidioides immitis RMSCC 3703]|uniref:Uncharacterized protein n=1 Tax=Coccidioides immitis RMSCC 3703 TaxID=454286 RepID=A0A0J8TJ81_COCIT|nr:hypothetical protein CISG_10167 [Coccidioides immitis RMSCC 3703]